MELIPRTAYLHRILPFSDTPMVKVLTGMRRCGKSSLLKLVANEIRQRGVAETNILQLDLDSLDDVPTTDKELNSLIKSRLPESGRCYIFLDEVQEVKGWERVVNSLIASYDVDIYLTGSNSRLLSTELATYIAGRYVSLAVSTLSYAEHLLFSGQEFGTPENFNQYLRLGGFPGLYGNGWQTEQHYQVMGDIYSSALIRDVLSRRQIRNPEMLQRVAAFALENVGNIFSASSLAAYFKSQRRRVDVETVINYLAALSESFLLNKVPRFDLEGKKLLTINEKYYAGDHALPHAVLGYSDRHLPGVLENIVWAELSRRGWTVYVGKSGNAEVDFVAEKGSQRCYLQVTTSMLDPATRQRELASLFAIKDSFPKFVLCLDLAAGGNENGIELRYLPDFLLDETVL